MLKRIQDARVMEIVLGLGLSLMLFPMLSAVSWAVDKKHTAASTTKPGEVRTKAYVDISKVVWPNPAAIARIKFEDLFTGQKIDPALLDASKKKQKQKWMDRLAGAEQRSDIDTSKLPFQLVKVFGVTADSKGNIYAADQAVGAIFIFDPKNKDHVEMIRNGKEVHFEAIDGLAMDDNDRLFVTDNKLHRVLVFNAKHEQEASVGMDVLVNPGGVAIDTENRFLYVVDTQSDVVDVFDADTFKLLHKIGKPSRKHDATAPGLFSLPTGVAVDKDGNVYVCDTFNNRVEIFDAEGEFISTFGKAGDGPADLERPKGIAIDSDGHIWVADTPQERIKVFNREGRLLIYFGQKGQLPGQFMGLNGVGMDVKNNRIISAETFPGRVQTFRYVTDAEAAAEKARRDGEEEKKSETAKK